jgi:short-subunit dehydrogenase
MQTDRKTALITGASGGIGYELSKLFAADGYGLVLVARSQEKLEQTATELSQGYGVNLMSLAMDLSDPAAPPEIYAALQAQSIRIDVLVNNAGFGVHGPFSQTDWAEELAMLHVNVVALTRLTKLLLPGMLERGWGRILNVGSTGSFAPAPLMAVYGASKAYVLSFSEALGEELRGTGVSVTALCPGVTRTGFQARAGVGGTRYVQSGAMSARQVAQIGYGALMRGRPVVVPGVSNSALIFLARFMPRGLATRIAYCMMERVES